jgi:antirestriction protein ArdC
MPAVSDLLAHVQRIAAANDIVIHFNARRPSEAFSLREFEEIETAPIRSNISYAVALHELGHLLGEHQHSTRALVREKWAWRWARNNALVWTVAMERYAVGALRRVAEALIRTR